MKTNRVLALIITFPVWFLIGVIATPISAILWIALSIARLGMYGFTGKWEEL